MTSSRLKGLTRLCLTTCACLSIGGCVSSTPVLTILSSFPCSDAIPRTYRVPVPGPGELPEGVTVGELGARYVEAHAALQIANGRTADVIAMAEACDAHQLEVAKALEPKPWWTKWTR